MKPFYRHLQRKFLRRLNSHGNVQTKSGMIFFHEPKFWSPSIDTAVHEVNHYQEVRAIAIEVLVNTLWSKRLPIYFGQSSTRTLIYNMPSKHSIGVMLMMTLIY